LLNFIFSLHIFNNSFFAKLFVFLLKQNFLLIKLELLSKMMKNYFMYLRIVIIVNLSEHDSLNTRTDLELINQISTCWEWMEEGHEKLLRAWSVNIYVTQVYGNFADGRPRMASLPSQIKFTFKPVFCYPFSIKKWQYMMICFRAKNFNITEKKVELACIHWFEISP